MSSVREKFRRIIFEADTRPGKIYDIALIAAILVNVAAVMLDSVKTSVQTESILNVSEWCFTFLFSADYITRIVCSRNRRQYITSFFGIVDLLSILPTFLGIFMPGSEYLAAIRFLRVLRTFKILGLSSYHEEARSLLDALRSSVRRIAVFVMTVLTLVVILGSLMYVIEGPQNGFTNIPISIYWAIVTLTTVGYGDISPATPLGRMIAAAVMLLGFAIIVVPTGIVSAHIAVAKMADKRTCAACSNRENRADALFCSKCGEKFTDE